MAAMWIAWALALPALIAIVGKLVRPDRPMLIPGRAACSCWSRSFYPRSC
jgi:hypothetical protein